MICFAREDQVAELLTATESGAPAPDTTPRGTLLDRLLELHALSRDNALCERSMPLGEWFEGVYLADSDRADLSPDHLQDFRRTIRRLSEMLEAVPAASQLVNQVLTAYRQWRIAQGPAAATVNRELTLLLSLANAAFARGLLDEKPRVKKLKLPDRAPTAYDTSDLDRLLAEAKKLKGRRRSGALRSTWWVALLLVGYYTGGRRMAILRRCWGDWDAANRVLQVFETKTGKESRRKLPRDAADAIEVLRRESRHTSADQPIWTGGRGNRQFYEELHSLLRAANIDARGLGLKVFHGLRATHGTLVEDVAGLAAAQESLQHSSPKITQASYIDRSKRKKTKDFAELLPTIGESQKLLFD